MHAISTCDFCVSYPIYETIKPVHGRRFSVIYTREVVNSIVCNVDRFYKPRKACRRNFNIFAPYVTKYYPDCNTNVKKQVSFLHNDQKAVSKNKRPRYQKSMSLYEFSSKDFYNTREYLNYYNNVQICYDFLMSERFLCDLDKSSSIYSDNRKSISKYTFGLNLAHANIDEVQKRSKRAGAGFKKTYRKSFPLMSTKSFPVSKNFFFLNCCA